MRQQTLFMPTMREAPSDADAASHKLLLRAGCIRPLASGVYTYLPLGWRVLNRIASIIRQEMDASGSQELLMPAMQPAELWEQSGRYEQYGPELIRLHDRHRREFALGPTHEEVITSLVRNERFSYRQFPMTMYQIQTKFRDERRPRFGLLRGREFLMKDAYSFDITWEGLDAAYRRMHEAYTRIFTRCGLNFRVVEADAGTIGGEGGTHEFMALADIGEDTVVACGCCGYGANLEKAEVRRRDPDDNASAAGIASKLPEEFHTPGTRTIEELVRAYQLDAGKLIKTLIYLSDGQPAAVLVLGCHEVNESKVKQYLGSELLEMADPETTARVTGAPVGFAGPIGLSIPVLVDQAVADLKDGTAGANRKDTHIRHVVPGRDFPLDRTGDFRNTVEGEPCPRCEEGILSFYRGIEVGHVFKLGTKYSVKLGAYVLNPAGEETALIMGCYGIGISRLMAAIVEQHHDGNGIVWPEAIAPFQVHIVPAAIHDNTQRSAAEGLYRRLLAVGIEALLDDREERPGVKFKDSDLIGIPYRIVVGKHTADGVVEVKARTEQEPRLMKIEEAVFFFTQRKSNMW
jgi:prolyl-tRNA synthetase